MKTLNATQTRQFDSGHIIGFEMLHANGKPCMLQYQRVYKRPVAYKKY